MTQKSKVHAYLAGPDVFFPRAKEIGEEKKAKLAAVGIKGHFPFDNELSPTEFSDLGQAATLIARANEQFMLECCKEGQVGIILANMMPYHGPSMDVGTGFEIGFMSALAEMKNNVIIIGYTDDPRTFEDKVIDKIYGGRENITEKDGQLYGSDGNTIEAFGKADNLMIAHAIEKTGGLVVSSFEEALALAKKLSDQKIHDFRDPNQKTL